MGLGVAGGGVEAGEEAEGIEEEKILTEATMRSIALFGKHMLTSFNCLRCLVEQVFFVFPLE